MCRLVQRCVAPSACVDALRGEMLVVLAGSRGLRALLAQDAELLFIEHRAPLV